MVIHLSKQQKKTYLERIGIRIEESIGVDLASLRKLHCNHLCSVPFENLDIHLGIPIVLDVNAIVDKVTVRRRGGFCYELNSAFAALLQTIGFEVQLLEARVIVDGKLGLPFDHLCLKVQLESAWLCDVGFGQCFFCPINWDSLELQNDLNGIYQFKVPDEEPYSYDLLENSVAVYRISREARQLKEFAEMCQYHQTSIDSHFTKNSICSIQTQEGRVTIKDRKLTETLGKKKVRRTIQDDDELLELYRRRFGIQLNRQALHQTEA